MVLVCAVLSDITVKLAINHVDVNCEFLWRRIVKYLYCTLCDSVLSGLPKTLCFIIETIW